MGLGKTVQTLAFLQNVHRSSNKPVAPSLIVAPTSVTTNWLYEARRFTPDLSPLVLHGPHRKKLFSSIPSHDIVITSYALLRLDRHELSQQPFSVLVLDEAQNIKNPTAATTKAAKMLKARARLALSGTPTENRPLELWSIIDFLMPGYLGTVDFFRNYVEKPILEEGPLSKTGEVLKAKIRPFILRRTKAEVERDLPPKIESVLHVEMTYSQRELYTKILEEVRPKVFDAIEKRGMSGATVSILTALLRLRQVCNHPNSINALKEIEGFDSGKFNLFKELVLEALESNRKILVFSQFKEMLSLMQSWVEEIGIPYLYLDGSTKDRQDLVDTFNSDPNIRLFLISLKAGGTGLNLTAADTVIIYDPWWNPAVESQAVDRAHRIGQVKTVNVYRLVTENSVEQRIMELKRKKASLVDALVNDNSMSPLTLTTRDLELLFESPLSEVKTEAAPQI
jgi:non-specific serine/threonine protein kinase